MRAKCERICVIAAAIYAALVINPSWDDCPGVPDAVKLAFSFVQAMLEQQRLSPDAV